MALLSVIRRWALRDELSIREIARRTGLSRNTAHLDKITRKIIRDEVHEATQDAEKINEPRCLH